MLSGFSLDKESAVGITFNPGCTQRLNERTDLYEFEPRALQPNNIELNVKSPAYKKRKNKESDCRRSSSIEALIQRQSQNSTQKADWHRIETGCDSVLNQDIDFERQNDYGEVWDPIKSITPKVESILPTKVHVDALPVRDNTGGNRLNHR